jgi:uncharacterized delta-60 repeat protein
LRFTACAAFVCECGSAQQQTKRIHPANSAAQLNQFLKKRPMPNIRQISAICKQVTVHTLGALFAMSAWQAQAVPGQPDINFGVGGKVVTPVGPGADRAYATAIQPDGKVVVVGGCSVNARTGDDFCAVRYNANGTLDTSFGTNGRATTDLSTDDTARAIAIQPDGKIILAGECAGTVGNELCALRYLTDGSLDLGFGSNGKIVTAAPIDNSAAKAIALQPDGKILFAGECNAGSANTNIDFCVYRYQSNGLLDSSFGTGGIVSTAIGMIGGSGNGGNDSVNGIALQPDGKMVVAGICDNGFISTYACLARYTANGTLDPTFGNAGVVSDPANDTPAHAVTLQPDGKILVAGSCVNGNSPSTLCATRYLNSGSLDAGFGVSGKASIAVANNSATARAIAVQPDGKILLAGLCRAPASTNDLCTARLQDNGTADTSFSAAVITTNVINSLFPLGMGIALQPDGKVLLAGTCVSGAGNNDFCAARLEGGPFGYKACSLDIDGDNRILATTDSLIHARIALGMTGNDVIGGINFAPTATRNTWPLIRNYLVSQCGISVAQ